MAEIPEQTSRRATDEEIAAARAWVEHACADWPEYEDGINPRAEVYERALAVIVFANDRQVSRG